MLRWCSYCQEFQGEGPPYDDLSITHGLCPKCALTAEAFDDDDFAHTRRLQRIQEQLREAGTSSDAQAAARAIEDASKAHVRAIDALMGIVAPMLYEVGVQWERAALSVQAEHRFTSFCEELFDIVSEKIEPPVPLAGAGSAVLLNASGNQHMLALRVLTLWLSERGIRTWVVTADQSLDDVVDLVRRLRPRLVLVSVALPEQRHGVLELVSAFSTLPESDRPMLVVGGYAVKMSMVEPIPGAIMAADINQLARALNL